MVAERSHAAPHRAAPHRTTFSVRYNETDQMGVVHHSEYVNYFELGRTEMMRAHGLEYAEMERRGVLLAVVDVALRYLRPARFGDELVVETRIAEVERVRVRFEYEVKVGDEVVCRGHTLLACVGRDLVPKRLPDEDRARMAALQIEPLPARSR
jgi:acyl-CoA thioester hydrolase